MTDAWKDIASYWGEKKLVRVPDDIVKGLDVPDDTKEFLLQVGVVRSSTRLVQSLGIDFDFARSGKVCVLSYLFADSQDALGKFRSWVAIGHCFEQLLCLQSGEGRVLLLDGTPEPGFLMWFANSSLAQLMCCITTSLEFFDKAKSASGESNSINQLVDKLSEVDSDAFAKPTNWWPTILKEVARGQI